MRYSSWAQTCLEKLYEEKEDVEKHNQLAVL